MSKHRCCCADCAANACSWWPCFYEVTFGGGVWYYRQRWFRDSNQYYIDCDSQQVDGPALIACLKVAVSAAAISGDACLSNYGNANCVCGYTSPAWNYEYSSQHCAAGDLTITVTAQRTFTLYLLESCSPNGCTASATGSVTQTVTKDCTYRLKVECSPALGPFGQTYSDGRIQWSAFPVGASSLFIAFPDRPAFLTDCGGLAFDLYDSADANSTFPTPQFTAWGWPTATAGVIGTATVPQFPFNDDVHNNYTGNPNLYNTALGYGAGVLTDPCSLSRVQLRDHISLNTYNNAEFGLDRWWSMSVPTTTITPGTGTTP